MLIYTVQDNPALTRPTKFSIYNNVGLNTSELVRSKAGGSMIAENVGINNSEFTELVENKKRVAWGTTPDVASSLTMKKSRDGIAELFESVAEGPVVVMLEGFNDTDPTDPPYQNIFDLSYAPPFGATVVHVGASNTRGVSSVVGLGATWTQDTISSNLTTSTCVTVTHTNCLSGLLKTITANRTGSTTNSSDFILVVPGFYTGSVVSATNAKNPASPSLAGAAVTPGKLLVVGAVCSSTQPDIVSDTGETMTTFFHGQGGGGGAFVSLAYCITTITGSAGRNYSRPSGGWSTFSAVYSR